MLCSCPDLLHLTDLEQMLPADNWRVVHLSTTKEMLFVIEHVAAGMIALGYPSKDVFAVRLGLEEAVVNAIKHGHGNDPTKHVEVRSRVSPENVLVAIEDEGAGFDPLDVPDPTVVQNLERSCGRGLLLMRTYLTWVRYNDRGNAVTLCKKPSAPLLPL
jgi:serine/threonine-protein kinase RsbW